MFSNEDSECDFWMEITSNHKIILKTSIYLLESINFNGLLRIDFKGGHKNPEEIIPTVPEYLRSYMGLWINIDEPHLHVYVEGYRPLAWAIPLKYTNFQIKELNNITDLSDLITNFAKEINLSSRLNIQQSIF